MQAKLQARLNALASTSLKPTKPRNLVTRSGARVRGFHHSWRFQERLSWETPEERTLIEVLDASPATRGLLSQSAVLTIPNENGSFEYTPDVAVLRADSSAWVIECKPLDILHDPQTQSRHAAIGMHLISFGINFLELPNEALPSSTVMQNLGRLATVGGPVQYPKSNREEDRRRISEQPPTTFCGSQCPRRRPVRGGCPRPRSIPRPFAS